MGNLPLFYVLIHAVLTLTKDSFQADSKEKLNIVLFFAKVDPSCFHLEEKACSLKQLDFLEKTRVKHSSDTTTDDETSEEKSKTSVHCNELLKDSLMDLTHFCHTVLEMKTAIASVTNKELTNDIQEPESNAQPSKTSRNFRKTRGTKMKFKKKKHPIEETIPSVHADKSFLNNVIRGPKHTEVFKIRLKRESSLNTETNEDEQHFKPNNFPRVKKGTRPKWDILDVVQHVRYSFLGKMFKDEVADEINKEENCNLGLDKIGKLKKDHGLFEVVRSTLKTVEEEPETGFLMVVFGGDLIDISEDHSALVQSIKYVTENTDPKHTLVIVTGSCPEDESAEERNSENNVVHIGGHFDKHKNIEKISVLMPVFAKGPHSDMFKECNLLYDVPLTIRKILEKNRGLESKFQNPDGTLWQRSDSLVKRD